MKYKTIIRFSQRYVVALFTRAWIEIISRIPARKGQKVALFTRAWIEMQLLEFGHYITSVALFTRAWIEIEIEPFPIRVTTSRPLHEGVD